jgi:hypothetical protein
VAVAARELRVDVDERLREVLAGRQIGERPHRVAEDVRTDDDGLTGLEVLDIDAEERCARRARLLDGRPPLAWP